MSRFVPGLVCGFFLLLQGTGGAQTPPATGQPLTPFSGSNQMASVSYAAASDGAGGAMVVWATSSNSLVAQRTTRSGKTLWSQPITVASLGQAPVAVALSSPGVIVGWWANSAAHVTRLSNDGSIPPGWPKSLGSASTLVADELGGVAYSTYDSQDRRFAHRLDASGTLVWPGGVELPFLDAFGTPVPTYYLRGDGQGGLFAIWEAKDAAGRTKVYAGHVTPSGGIDSSWPANGRLLSAVDGDCFLENPYVQGPLADGAGGLLVPYKSILSAGNRSIYVQKITGSGSIANGWPASGVLVGTFYEPVSNLWSDGAGGAIATCRVKHGNFDTSIYYRRIAADGSLPWPLAEKRVVASIDEDVVVPGGPSGPLLVWCGLTSASGGPYEIRVEELDPATGVIRCSGPVCSGAGGWRGNVRLIADGQGGASVLWADSRRSQDIFLGWATSQCRTPVSVTDLEAVVGNGWVDVRWRYTGTGSQRFEVARSLDGDGPFEPVCEYESAEHAGSYTCRDASVASATHVFYRLAARDETGAVSLYGPISLELSSAGAIVPTLRVVGGTQALPIALHVEVPARTQVDGIGIYDVAGRWIAALGAARDGWTTGTVEWDGRDSAGRRLARGVYLARLSTTRGSASCRIVLLADH